MHSSEIDKLVTKSIISEVCLEHFGKIGKQQLCMVH